jgi:hypothetical protein
LQSVDVEDIADRRSRISSMPGGSRGISRFMKSGRSKKLVEVRFTSWIYE